MKPKMSFEEYKEGRKFLNDGLRNGLVGGVITFVVGVLSAAVLYQFPSQELLLYYLSVELIGLGILVLLCTTAVFLLGLFFLRSERNWPQEERDAYYAKQPKKKEAVR